MLETLRTLTSFSPVSSNQPAVAALLEYVQARLTSKGLHVRTIDTHGVYSLYASTTGRSHSTVMLQGHVDVVPGGQAFRIENSRVYGRGSFDMLFAVASYLELIDQLDDVSAHDISLFLTSDEELGGEHGAGAIMKKPEYTTDVCIIPDAGEKFGELSIGAKGIYQLELQFNGQSHHASRPWEGDNAAEKAIHFLSDIQHAFDRTSRKNSTLTISHLDAGSILSLNQGPSDARIGIDIRYRDGEEFDRISTIVHELIARYDGHIVAQQIGKSYELDIQNEYVDMFIGMYEQAIGKKPELTVAHGSSDARFFTTHAIPVIMFRPDGHGAHSDDEWVSIESWKQFHDLLTRYVTTLSGTNKV